ncbi:hypothetical protein [uncultured Campylobacter sp.]|uniref:hypothetical protein n=1 Tax=uncultured Campylobacter sp. TaxID=218934 RepID=UPI002610D734|nr:hypothetical protein [uncultured Campylobacter sp.]
MKKIVFLILLFAAVVLALYVTSRVNPSLFAEIKVLGALLNATIFGVALIALAIGEKELVRFPFLTASLLALFSGLVEGVLLFENRYYIAITAVAFVAFVFYLQIRHKRFSNKIYENSADESSKNLDGNESENLKDAGFGGAKEAQDPQSKDATADEILNFKSGGEISNSQSEDEILNSNGDLGENFASGAGENSTHRAGENSDENFKISNGSADENSEQNFNQDSENSKLGSNENSADGARRDR